MEVLSLAGFILTLIYLVSCQSLNKKESDKIDEQCAIENKFFGKMLDIKSDGASHYEKCYISCVYMKTKEMKEDGTFDVDIFKANLDLKFSRENKEIVLKAWRPCFSQVKPVPGDNCETAYKMLLCKRNKLTLWKKPDL